MLDLRIDAPNLSATQALAKALAPALKAGDCLLLSGDLGAGKSAFSRAIIQSIAGAEVEVPSPTYTLVQAYELPTLRIFHYDLYRIESLMKSMSLIGKRRVMQDFVWSNGPAASSIWRQATR